MSGVADYIVGFFLSMTHTHTHTHAAADVIHAAVQMHISTSPSKHLHSHSYLRHTQRFPRITDSLDKDEPKHSQK